jgi:cupin 2 domain-containing protein
MTILRRSLLRSRKSDSDRHFLVRLAQSVETMHASNLFEAIPPQLPDELVEVLAEGQGHVRIVRLVSQGHASADGFWYDQDEDEWVVLLSGRAVLSFEDSVSGEVRAVALKPGDWLHIPPHARHRVESTDPDEATVWLAVHWG